MLPKIFIIGLNILAIKEVLSTTYNASPTVSYPPNYPVLASALATPTVTVATSSPVPTAPISAVASPIAGPIATIAASPIPVAASTMPVTTSTMPVSTSSVPINVSPMPVSPSSCAAEAKAYFVSGPIPDPKVTVLGDIPSVVEVAPKIYPDGPALVDSGYIEVKATVCKEPALNAPASTRVLLEKNSSPITPVKRLSKACASDEPFLAAHKSTSNYPICPGISKMDLIPSLAMTQEKKKNPIEFDGLLDGFMSCL